MKEVYRDTALSYIPKILQLCDRNLFHSTYGCFDRSYWHYKTMDFSSGMYQEYVLPLALVYQNRFDKDHPWYKKERVKELCLAGIRYAARSSRKDGSCDDYYPFERALGAIGFSLYAATESLLLLNQQDEDLIKFCCRRADYLVKHDECGQLSNHQALAALSLFNVWLLSNDQRYLSAAQKRIERVLSWQSSEGWFQEYEGCDLGYLTASISFLAQYYIKSQDHTLVPCLQKAIEFASHFIHRDGSYGGEYGSRNTYHYYPHGFELMAQKVPVGTAMNDCYAAGIHRGKRHDNSDDRIFGHLVYDYLQACLAYSVDRKNEDFLPRPKKHYYGKAGLFVVNAKAYQVVVNVHKGGVIKAYNHEGCFFSDQGVVGEDCRKTQFVSQIYRQGNQVQVTEDSLKVSAGLYICKDKSFTPIKQILFRLANLCVARFSSNLFRRLLQRLIIFKKKTYGGTFERSFVFGEEGFNVFDKIAKSERGARIEKLYFGSDHTSIYTAAANSYQESVLLPWVNLKEGCNKLNSEGMIEVQREVRAP